MRSVTAQAISEMMRGASMNNTSPFSANVRRTVTPLHVLIGAERQEVLLEIGEGGHH
jgi:hypothetical protein